MKKIIFAIGGIMIGILISKPTETENLYAKTMYVTEVNYETDVVTLVDYNGFLWEFYGTEDWMVNDICSCIMDTNGTETIFDDAIVSTIYNGVIGCVTKQN